MGRFKAGDRVRILAGHPYWLGERRNSVGEEGEGVYVGRAGKERRGKHLVEVTYDDSKTAELSFKGRELEPLAEAWVPKVGDRVRCTKDHDPGKQFTAGKEYIVRYADDESVGVVADDKGTPNGWAREFFAEPLPVAEQPAGLVVEAGKFYRTRDGRKVPAIATRGEDFPFRAGGNHYNADGSHFYGEDYKDLVAEWVDPDSPVIAVTTPEPAAAPAKFKVGDRVRVVDTSMEGTVETRSGSGRMSIRWSEGGGVSFEWWEDHELVLLPTSPTDSFIVARLTANGQPRPNARPRVHTTLASATAEASRLANRLGDDFAVYQRVATESVDAGPVPTTSGWPFELAGAKCWLAKGRATSKERTAFQWSLTPQGVAFWGDQSRSLTPLGRAILRKWIAEVEANQKVAA